MSENPASRARTRDLIEPAAFVEHPMLFSAPMVAARAEGVEPQRDITSYVPRFHVLWDSINGERPGCSWDDNPWVWAISFKVVRP